MIKMLWVNRICPTSKATDMIRQCFRCLPRNGAFQSSEIRVLVEEISLEGIMGMHQGRTISCMSMIEIGTSQLDLVQTVG